MNKSPLTLAPLTLAIGGLLAMAAGIGIGRFVYTPILPPMVEALHLSKSEAGLIASANFVGYLLGAIVATLPLPGSRRGWLLGALIVNAAGLAAMGVANSLALLLLLRLIAGVASAFSADLRLGPGARSAGAGGAQRAVGGALRRRRHRHRRIGGPGRDHERLAHHVVRQRWRLPP